MKKIMQVSNLYKNFGAVVALKGVEVDIFEGAATALLGENGAGKSTLIKSISGVIQPNAGIIKIDNQQVKFHNVKEATKKGISVVHQELQLCDNLSIAENIFLGRVSNKYGFVNYKDLIKKTNYYLKMLNLNINPKTLVKDLTIAQQQMVEIAKAISLKARIIILDEPTDSLSNNEVKQLFKIINNLKKQKIGFLYVTHRMEEVKQICEYYTIFKDGNFVKKGQIENITIDEIIEKMIGRKLEDQFPKIEEKPKKKILVTKQISGKNFYNISLDIYSGEILGIAGLVGSGRSEFVKSIIGAYPKKSGQIIFKDSKIQYPNIKKSIKNGIYYVTENRKLDGLNLEHRIDNNIIISNLSQIKNKFKIISQAKIKQATLDSKNKLNIKFYKGSDLVNSLSGGNQQKVLLAKALFTNPQVLILDEPTRGVDVGSRKEIYNIIINYAKEKKAIVFISSDLPEIIGISERVAVFSKGKLAGILNKKDISEKNIMQLAIKGGN